MTTRPQIGKRLSVKLTGADAITQVRTEVPGAPLLCPHNFITITTLPALLRSTSICSSLHELDDPASACSSCTN